MFGLRYKAMSVLLLLNQNWRRRDIISWQELFCIVTNGLFLNLISGGDEQTTIWHTMMEPKLDAEEVER